MESILEQEKLKWKQIAKQNWLAHGDRNIKFYHMHANQRRQANKIHQIMDQQGVLTPGQTRIGDIFNAYFNELFHSSNPSNLESCLSNMEARVTKEMNAQLLNDFYEFKVQESIFKCLL